mgnify:CR=1 FL=1
MNCAPFNRCNECASCRARAQLRAAFLSTSLAILTNKPAELERESLAPRRRRVPRAPGKAPGKVPGNSREAVRGWLEPYSYGRGL